MRYVIFATPYGWCGLVTGNQGLRRVFLPELAYEDALKNIMATFPGAIAAPERFTELIQAFEGYFAGAITTIAPQLDFAGATMFQRHVWAATAAISYGTVQTYGDVARRIGRPHACRAVGNALARNPFPIIIPCHRVICRDGSLGGFSATCGVALKKKLLALEGIAVTYEK